MLYGLPAYCGYRVLQVKVRHALVCFHFHLSCNRVGFIRLIEFGLVIVPGPVFPGLPVTGKTAQATRIG